jgi:hypothetical protein
MTSQIDSVSATHLFNCYQLTSKPEVNCCYNTYPIKLALGGSKMLAWFRIFVSQAAPLKRTIWQAF